MSLWVSSLKKILALFFISDRGICLVYVDEALFFVPERSFIEEVIWKLRQIDLELEVEDSVTGFLGIHKARNSERGIVTLIQRGLAKRIIDALDR